VSDSIRFEPGSFKDPDGRIFYLGDSVYRSLSGHAAGRMQRLDEQGHLAALIEAGLMVPTRLVSSTGAGIHQQGIGPNILEHDRIEVISYSYEWPFALLRDAAVVTLEIIERCLAFDCILKDATPYNIALYKGHPVLIDVLSIDRYEDGMPWEGYAQFCREFLFPLLLAAHKKVDVHSLLRGSLNGISNEIAAALFSFGDLRKAGVLKHVKLQALLQRSFKRSDFDAKRSFKDSRFGKDLILTNVKGLKDLLNDLAPSTTDSTWIDYTDTHSYDSDEEAEKMAFVQAMLETHGPDRVIDIGCNTGVYSRIASKYAATVISLDFDASCIDRLYRGCRKDGIHNIVPLVADLLNPSPGLGWMMRERASLFDRIRGDDFLALALVHHIAITGNVPLENFVEALSKVAGGGVVEWVDKSDPMVQTLLKNRRDVFARYTWDHFKEALEQYFDIEKVTDIGGGRRRLCQVRPKHDGGPRGS
jgi:SAM-dependent methyltransferase